MGAIIGGIASLVGAGETASAQTSAANTAANAQEQAASSAQATQLGMYNQTRADLLPYNTTGQNALAQLSQLYGITSPAGGPAASATAATTTATPGGYLPNEQSSLSILGGTGSSIIQAGRQATGLGVDQFSSQASTFTPSQLASWGATPAQIAQLQALPSIASQQQAASSGTIATGTTTPAGTPAGISAGATAALQNTPGYQFQLNTGLNAAENSAAASGQLRSGNTLTALNNYAQGVAQSTAWTPYVNQLAQLAGLGENAAAITGNNASTAGAGIASSQIAGGNAAAAGAIGGANALTGAINSGTNNFLAALNSGSSFGNSGSGSALGLLTGGGGNTTYGSDPSATYGDA